MQRLSVAGSLGDLRVRGKKMALEKWCVLRFPWPAQDAAVWAF